MKATDNDRQIRELLKNFKPESPGRDFTTNVMNRVFAEEAAIQKAKREQVFGRGFWIILALFIGLTVAMVVISTTGTMPESNLPEILRGLDTGKVSEGYNSIFSKINTLPLALTGIFLALSILLFADRFFTSKRFT